MSAKNEKLDRDALHDYLERKSNHKGLIVVGVGRLAEDLGIRADHMSRVLREMVAAGRLTRIKASMFGVTFRVIPFEKWAAETGYKRPKPPRRRRRAS